MKLKAVLALPKTTCSAQTYKSISFIWIVWSTPYVYLYYKIWTEYPTHTFIQDHTIFRASRVCKLHSLTFINFSGNNFADSIRKQLKFIWTNKYVVVCLIFGYLREFQEFVFCAWKIKMQFQIFVSTCLAQVVLSVIRA